MAPEIRRPQKEPPTEWKVWGIDVADVDERNVLEVIRLGNRHDRTLTWMIEHVTGDLLPILPCTPHGFRVVAEPMPI